MRDEQQGKHNARKQMRMDGIYETRQMMMKLQLQNLDDRLLVR